MTRTDRLLSIVLALQARRWQRAEDLAEMLDVSLRTIYRDTRALAAAGIPLQAVPGKGYRLYEGYFLDPVMFTTDEALVLLLGSDYAAQHLEERYRGAARRAAKKIEAILPSALHDLAATLQESIRLAPFNAFDDPARQTRLQQLRRALTEQRTVRFRYPPRRGGAAPGGALDLLRTVDPYGLVERGEAWYLVGYCHLRQHVRQFRLDRMEDVALLSDTFERPAGYRLPPGTEAETRDVTVRLLFDNHVAGRVRETPPAHTVETETLPGGLLLTLKVKREAELIPWLLGWGAHVRVVEPAALGQRLADEAERIAAQYQTGQLLLA